MTPTQEQTQSEAEAQAQLDSIVAMVSRLEHARECNGDACDLSAAEIMNGIGSVGTSISDDDRDQYHDEDDTQQYIIDNALDVSVRSDWHSPGEKPGSSDQFLILLCTGGPAVRIVGELDAQGQPDSARIEHQDWGTPWTRLWTTAGQDGDLMTYAEQFYFGDGS